MTGQRWSQCGDVSLYVLGTAAVLAIVVVWSGLADTLRVMTIRTMAGRSLAAAVASAAREDLADPAAVEARFRSILAANLGGREYTATVTVLPEGGSDPLTGQLFDGGAVIGRLELPVDLQFLGRYAPEVRLRLVDWQYSLKRKAGP